MVRTYAKTQKKPLKPLGTPWTTEQIDEEINRLLEKARGEVLTVGQANHYIDFYTDWNPKKPVINLEILFDSDQAKEDAKKMIKKTAAALKPSRAFCVFEGYLRNPKFLDHVTGEVLIVMYTDTYRKRTAMQKIIKKLSDDSITFKDPEIQNLEPNEVTDGFLGGCKFIK